MTLAEPLAVVVEVAVLVAVVPTEVPVETVVAPVCRANAVLAATVAVKEPPLTV